MNMDIIISIGEKCPFIASKKKPFSILRILFK